MKKFIGIFMILILMGTILTSVCAVKTEPKTIQTKNNIFNMSIEQLIDNTHFENTDTINFNLNSNSDPSNKIKNDCWLEVAFDKGFNTQGSIDAIIENVGSSDCFDINWTISSYTLIGSVKCSSNGVISNLSINSYTTVTCNPILMGFIDIMSVTINAITCGITFADTSFAIILFGTLIIVIF